MARSASNLILRGFSGALGEDLIVKQYKDKVVISKKPEFSKHQKKSVFQKQKNIAFAEAVKYAKSIIRDPKKKAARQKKLAPGKLVYHAAIQEYLKNKEGYAS